MIEYSYAKSTPELPALKNQNYVKVREAWVTFCNKMSTHKVIADKEEADAFIGGLFDGNGRKKTNMVSRTMLTIDIDRSVFGEIVEDLERAGKAYLAYTTFSGNVRVVLPLKDPIHPDDYKDAVKKVVGDLGWSDMVDGCSYTPSQIMFTPSVPEGVTGRWECNKDRPWWTVEIEMGWGDEVGEVDSDDWDDIIGGDGSDGDEDEIAESDVNRFHVDDMRGVLARYPAEGLDYDRWLAVGAAIHHSTLGSDEGYSIWLGWSALNREKHDKRQMKTKWDSFDHKRNGGITFASVVMWMNDRTQEVASQVDNIEGRESFNEWLEGRAAQVMSDRDIDAFVDNLATNGYAAKDLGFPGAGGRGRLVRAIKSRRSELRREAGDVLRWRHTERFVYLREDARFVDLDNGFVGIPAQSFNRVHNHEVEGRGEGDVGLLSEIFVSALGGRWADAVGYNPNVPYRELYWDSEGVINLNKCDVEKIEVSEEDWKRLDDECESVAILREWLDWFFGGNEAKIKIWLDFMTLCFWKVGVKVRWCPVIQGCEGIGKSLVMEGLMRTRFGEKNSSVVDGSKVSDRFRGWSEGKLMILVNELYVGGGRMVDRRNAANEMKSLITDNVIQMEKKGVDARNVENWANYAVVTNHKDAIPNEDGGSRRYAFLFSAWQDRAAMLKSLEGNEGSGSAASWFERLAKAVVDMNVVLWLIGRGSVAGLIDEHLGNHCPAGGDTVEAHEANYMSDTMEILWAMNEGVSELICEEFVVASAVKAELDMSSYRVGKAMDQMLGYVKVERNLPRGLSKNMGATRKKVTFWHKNEVDADECLKVILDVYGDEKF